LDRDTWAPVPVMLADTDAINMIVVGRGGERRSI
jgi:hypothetical protein